MSDSGVLVVWAKNNPGVMVSLYLHHQSAWFKFIESVECFINNRVDICSGSHKGTGIKPLRWKVSKEQRLFQICACKYTKDPPFCDATHTNLPCQVLQRQEVCPRQQDSHHSNSKLCTGCGWVPDFWLVYTVPHTLFCDITILMF